MIDRKSKAKSFSVVWGDWDKVTVRLDWDLTPLGEVKLGAYRTCFWHKLEGFIILRSSVKEYVVKVKGKVLYRYLKRSYLLVFDKPVKWETNVKVMNWVNRVPIQHYRVSRRAKPSQTADSASENGNIKHTASDFK